MHSFTAVIAASALLTAVSGTPLYVRSNTCGVAPAGSNTKNLPITQPTGIKTAVDCQSQCNAKSDCQSFCFGLIDNTIQCKLFSVPASSIPTQSSANLVAYDKACSAVPSVVPTSSNPTGKAHSNKQQASDSQQKSSTSSKTSGTNKLQRSTDQQNSGSNKAPTAAKPASSPAPKQNSDTQQSQQQAKQNGASSLANTCGSKPAGTVDNQPIATPNVVSIDGCKLQCEADSECQSFTCGTVDNAMICKLYAVIGSAIPPPDNAAQKSALVAYDVGCSI